MKRKAVVLLSGGLDSATAAAIAGSVGFDLLALSFDYGQRHARELQSAKAVAQALAMSEHRIVSLDMESIAPSALTSDIQVPVDRDRGTMCSDIPSTYVPARNTIFLSYALAYAETSAAFDIYIGVSQIDYSGYPDCRIEFIRSFEQTANLATQAGVEGPDRLTIHAPLINLTKAETISRGLQLGVDYSLTWSCYLGGARACGRCDSCKLRLAGFEAAGVPDPIEYETGTLQTQ